MKQNRPSVNFRKSPIALAVAAFAGVVGISAAAPGDPVTGEIPVNTTTSDSQDTPAVAIDADGDFVIAWTSYGQDGSKEGVFARRFAADGTPLSGEIPVNITTSEQQSAPAVAMDAGGEFVVAWHSFGQDGSGLGVFARRFDAAGLPASGEIAVNTTTSGLQGSPNVAMDADGNFVVAWDGEIASNPEVFARLFDAAGAPLTGEIPVNTYTTSSQRFPSVAMEADGDFVVAWQSSNQDGDYGGVYARRFSASGAPKDGGEIAVNTTTTNSQNDPSVAVDTEGNFVVAWSDNFDGSNIAMRLFDADGAALTGEVAVSAVTSATLAVPVVAMDADGDFVVAWENYLYGDGGAFDVVARRFAANGTAVSDEIAVNTTTSDGQQLPAVASDTAGGFVVAWQGGGQDGNNRGVFARVFEGSLRCSMAPATSCAELPTGSLSFKNSLKPGKSQFKYKGSAGDTTAVPELFGDPTSDADNVLCVYNADGLVLQLAASTGETNSKGDPAWKINDSGATKFGNSAGNDDGVIKVQQKPGAKGKVAWSAGKLNFVIPEIPLTGFPIVVQNQITGGACTETSFDEADFSKNDAEKVKAKRK